MVTPVATQTVPRVSSLSCASCGAGIELHAQGWAVTVVCAACGAQLDATDANLQVLQYGERVQLVPRIPLGTRGTWKGAQWEAIGCQVVTITVEGVDYSWTEYVCFNPYRGFLYLSEYEGHWNVIEKLRRRPEKERDGERPTVELEGRTFKHFQTAVARTTAALGEFPWELRVGDSIISRDFVAPPYLLSAEASDNEVTWSLGTYTPPDVIRKMFSLEKGLIDPVGVFANQPNPHDKLAGRVFSRMGLAVLALFMMLLLNVALASNRTVFTQQYSFHRMAGDEAAFVTPAFDLDGRSSSIAIDIEAPFQNDWIFFTISLINESTGDVREVTRQLSYYTGTDSDGRWTEGSQSETVRIASVPAGRYFLRVQQEGGEPGNPVASYTLKVRRDAPHYGFYGLAFLALVVPAVIAVFPSASFEGRRWAESDHAPSSSSDDEEDE
ncbi:MAG: DUF4178 domain-containing protein [Gemmatimonadaceae bacterium]|nr:DUF4178 domain-containing protein [Gemmatimonadaceae bacterium]